LFVIVRSSVSRSWVRGGIAIVIAVSALALPARADAHGRSSVIALDYEARLRTRNDAAPGVQARVLDGDRKLELAVAPAKTVIVRGYAGEDFLRFSPAGVSVNLKSPTAVADKLVPEGSVLTFRASSPPRWQLLTDGHRLAWHDHRLGPQGAAQSEAGLVGSWSIPIVIDGTPTTIEGGVWRAAKPSLLPWLAVWMLALCAAAAVLRMSGNRLRRVLVSIATPVASGTVLLVAIGFTASSARAGWTRWAELAFPAALAVAAAAIAFVPTRQRMAAAACVAGFAIAAGLQNLPVFAHGYVISALPGSTVRAAVAAALAAGAFVLVLAFVDLWRGTLQEPRRPVKRPLPRMTIPKGRTR
jgi:hypothetical protein